MPFDRFQILEPKCENFRAVRAACDSVRGLFGSLGS